MRSQRWAVGPRLFTCSKCSASTVSSGQHLERCPFCGATALLAAAEDARWWRRTASFHGPAGADRGADLGQWLKQGFFIPDDLAPGGARPAAAAGVCAVWSFNATLNARWKAKWRWARAATGAGSGAAASESFFHTHLQPGTRSLPARLLREGRGLRLQKLVGAQPAFLAGCRRAATTSRWRRPRWRHARACCTKRGASSVQGRAGAGYFRVERQTAATLRPVVPMVLLPLWVGAYQYRQKPYRVLG